MDDEMREVIDEFLVESHENLDQLDRDFVTLERAPGDLEVLASVFRTIHTIKGTGGFLAFGHLESVTHVGESLLSRLRDGEPSAHRRDHHRAADAGRRRPRHARRDRADGSATATPITRS